ncbi:GntR family transcriptional regulator [Aliidongia dinghuensis]|uniref:GntR family transcriptional regulator n=1 Tax=Aliidongia dinghuensis TaxID=1867774 RepID=A0A8J2YT95_9PROT|nr:GntR family transcriptional regulator [Aliidongia dinghuensis]GGF15572.1 GntR family transcriptional regulator [Aliidongia dinghuensis]
MLDVLDILRTRSLASLAAQEIERLITTGELKAGERLNELALAARLGVSRGPIREAVRGLEGAGLVVTVVNQGSFVRKVSAEEAHELYEIRVALTGNACAKLALHATREQVATLRGLVRQMTAAQTAGDAAGYYALNLDFHSTLLRFAGNRRALKIYEELGAELNLFRRRSLVSSEGMRASNAEHAEIVRAIAAGDPVRARAAGETHIAQGMSRFIASSPPVEAANPPGRIPRRRKAAS